MQRYAAPPIRQAAAKPAVLPSLSESGAQERNITAHITHEAAKGTADRRRKCVRIPKLRRRITVFARSAQSAPNEQAAGAPSMFIKLTRVSAAQRQSWRASDIIFARNGSKILPDRCSSAASIFAAQMNMIAGARKESIGAAKSV